MLFILTTLERIDFLPRPSRKTSSFVFRREYCGPGPLCANWSMVTASEKKNDKLVHAKRARSHFFRLLPVPNKTSKAISIAKLGLNVLHILFGVTFLTFDGPVSSVFA